MSNPETIALEQNQGELVSALTHSDAGQIASDVAAFVSQTTFDDVFEARSRTLQNVKLMRALTSATQHGKPAEVFAALVKSLRTMHKEGLADKLESSRQAAKKRAHDSSDAGAASARLRRTYSVEWDMLPDQIESLDKATALIAQVDHASPYNAAAIWSQDRRRNLTYQIVIETFPDAHRATFVQQFEGACATWRGVCDVRFVPWTASASEPEALFPVRYEANPHAKLKGAIAVAFLPHEPVNKRQLRIYPGFFFGRDNWDRQGVLCHELGHILGFRHEHERPEALHSSQQGAHTDEHYQVTKFDKYSIMGYPHEGVGTHEFRVSPMDRLGAQALYGLPEHLKPSMVSM